MALYFEFENEHKFYNLGAWALQGDLITLLCPNVYPGGQCVLQNPYLDNVFHCYELLRNFTGGCPIVTLTDLVLLIISFYPYFVFCLI